ncbi:hypothetical protein IW148_002808 [Coemansia sp. RSA 1199]|nr:hypothetical protein IW148_002808 [Coemansia sp. RSA 1199]
MDGAWTQVVEYVQTSERGLQHRMHMCSLSDQTSNHMELSITEPTLLCKLRHTHATPDSHSSPTNSTPHQSLNSMQPTEIAHLLKTTVTDRTLSLENQQLAFNAIAECTWFEDDVPAVIQSQVLALLSEQTLVGLFVPLTMRHHKVTSSIRMISKAINSGELSMRVLHTLCHELADRVRQLDGAGDGVFHVLDALANAMPVARASHAWVVDWTHILVTSVARNKESKKLAALMLRFVNKFGSMVDAICREQIDGAARALTTPLKKAVIAAIARQSI